MNDKMYDRAFLRFFAALSEKNKIDGKIEMQSIYYAFFMNKYRLKRKYFYCYG